MSGPKGTEYTLEQRRREEMERRERERREREAEIERQRLAEERERQRKIEEEIRKECKSLEAEEKSAQDVLNSVMQKLETEKKRQQERKQVMPQSNPKVEEKRESVIDADDIARMAEIANIGKQEQKKSEIPEVKKENVEDFVRQLIKEQSQKHSLLDSYLADMPESEEEVIEANPERQQFEQLLFSMEEEYKEMVSDRAFFAFYKEQIMQFETVCKAQQEYGSYPILREVYFGEFTNLKKLRKNWHKKYESWKERFDEAYIQYRSMCRIMGITPQHYFLNPQTVEEDVEKLQEMTKKLEKEHMCIQESLEITRVFNEVMAEMGYQVLGTREIEKKSGGKVHNTIFSYGEGSGIHVIDSDGRITMEIVGLDDENTEMTEEDMAYLEEEQVHFCDSFEKIEKELEKRGVVLKERIRKLPPSKKYSMVMGMDGYMQTEHKAKTKKLSKINKKKVREQQGKKYRKV